MIKRNQSMLLRAGKVRLGTKKGQNTPGRNSEFFRIDLDAGQNEDALEKIKSLYGDSKTGNLKELTIYFPKVFKNVNDAMQFAYDDNYEVYSAQRKVCHGNGETAVRTAEIDEETGKIGKLIAKEEIACPCPLLTSTGKSKICSQAGRLKFGIVGIPFQGYYEILTHSWNALNGFRSAVEMYQKLLKEQFFTTKFVIYKETKMLKGYPQYIVTMKIHPEHADRLPSNDSLSFSFDEEEDEDNATINEAIVEIPEGFDGNSNETTSGSPKRSRKSKQEKEADSSNELETANQGESAVSETQESEKDEPQAEPNTQVQTQPEVPASKPGNDAETTSDGQAYSDEVLDTISTYLELEENEIIELIKELAEGDFMLLQALSDAAVVTSESVNEAAQKRLEDLIDTELEQSSIQEPEPDSQINPATVEADYGFDAAVELVSKETSMDVLEAIKAHCTPRLKLKVMSRIKQVQAEGVKQEAPIKKTDAPASTVKTEPTKSPQTTTAKNTATEANQTANAPAEKPSTVKAGASTASPSKVEAAKAAATNSGGGLLGMKRDRLRRAAELYGQKFGLKESSEEIIEMLCETPINEIAEGDLLGHQKALKEATESGKPLH